MLALCDAIVVFARGEVGCKLLVDLRPQIGALVEVRLRCLWEGVGGEVRGSWYDMIWAVCTACGALCRCNLRALTSFFASRMPSGLVSVRIPLAFATSVIVPPNTKIVNAAMTIVVCSIAVESSNSHSMP